MELIAVTNNNLITQVMSEKGIFAQIVFSGCAFLDVLKISMGMVRNGHELLTHPFLGNLPPYETPFKTVILSESAGVIDFNSLNVISGALNAAERAISERPKPVWGKSDLEDFKKNDLVLVERWLMKVYLPMLRKVGEKRDEG